MKVKEAIKLLQSMDQETDVYLDFGLYFPEKQYTPKPSVTYPNYQQYCTSQSYPYVPYYETTGNAH